VSSTRRPAGQTRATTRVIVRVHATNVFAPRRYIGAIGATHVVAGVRERPDVHLPRVSNTSLLDPNDRVVGLVCPAGLRVEDTDPPRPSRP